MALEGVPVPGTGLFPNAIRDAVHDPTVPSMIEETNVLVTDSMATTRLMITQTVAAAQDSVAALAAAKLPPALPDPPAAPSIVTSVNGGIGLVLDTPPDLGSIGFDGEVFATFSPDAVSIPDVTGAMMAYVPIVGGLVIPTPPTFNPPSPIAQPAIITDFGTVTAPTPAYGDAPVLLPLNMPVLNLPAIPVFGDTAPTFNVLPPSPIINWTEPAYSSDVKEAVRLLLLSMLAGGTGLPADVEQAIWERDRARQDSTAAKSIEEAIEQWAVRGFAAPQGYLNGQVQSVRDDANLKINGISRDVAIKQADLEQTNRNNALERSIQYEQIFSALYMQIVDRNFQIAKFQVETQVQLYNMRVTAFNVEQSIFAQKIVVYKTQLDAVFVYLKAFEALVEAEKAKAEMNTALVQAYESKVKAYAAQVDAFHALVQAQQTRADLQKTIIEGFKAQVEGNVALVQGERAKFDAFTAQVQGITAQATLEEANSRAYIAYVQGFALKNEISIKRAEAQIAANRLHLDFDVANMSRITALHSTELARIQANLAAFQAVTQKSVAKFQADKEIVGFNLQSQIEISRIAIAKYQVLLEQWKTRSLEIIQMATINAESLRAAGQITSNIASGALASLHVSAGLSAGVNAGETHSVSSGDTTAQQKSDQTSNQYSVIHQFNHKV